MSSEYRKEINKALLLVEQFFKTRVSLKISYGLIGAGLSILGFNNFVPYILIMIDPNIKDIAIAQNDIYTLIAVILIVFGSTLPIFVQVFDYYRRLYLEDLEKINLIRSEYTRGNFQPTIIDIKTNLAISYFQSDKLEDFTVMLLNPDFLLHNKVLNEKIKYFATKLESYQQMLSTKLEPAQVSDNYILPRVHKTRPVIDKIQSDGDDVYTSFNDMYTQIEKFEYKKFMRFFT